MVSLSHKKVHYKHSKVIQDGIIINNPYSYCRATKDEKKKNTRELANPTYFKGIVGSLRYLTSIRPYIV